MLVNYFLRVALIVAAVLAPVQLVQAAYWGIRQNAATCGWTYGNYVDLTGRCDNYGHCVDHTRASCDAYMAACAMPNTCVLYSPVCTAPQVLDAAGELCIDPPPPPSDCTVYPVSTFIQSISGAGNQPMQACVQNCLFDTGSGMSWGISPNRQWASSGRSTGTFCEMNTAAASSANDPACPAGESLNASGVCAPLAPCPYDASIYAINVNCHAPLCATDVSLYASDSRCFSDPNDPVSSVPAVVDCAVTPDAAACVGAASGVDPVVTGNVGTSGVYAAPTYGGGSASGVGGDSLTFDNVADNVQIGEKNVSVGVLSPVLVGSSGGCPAPSPMVLHGQTYYFQWTTYCNFAAWIKPLLLAFAWLAAAGILVGGFVA